MKRFLFVLLSLFTLNQLYSQGCSDAGVCSIGGMQDHGENSKKYSLALNTSFATGEQKVQIVIPQLEFNAKLNAKHALQLKLPYNFISGNLGSNNGLGDITLTISKNLIDSDKDLKIGLNLGFKYGVNKANANDNSFNLPMPYQTSLGTHDLLIGFDAKLSNKWLFAIGFQMPIYQFNENGYDTAKITSNLPEQKQYFTSNKLYRRPDLVLRIDRQFKLGTKSFLSAGILPIYHLGHDRFTDTNGQDHAISGSKGLTFNINLGYSIALSESFSASLRYASPLLVREVRPDGLTRAYVAGLELKYTF